MKIQIVGLGNFGMFLAEHFVSAGWEVSGIDVDLAKRAGLEKMGGTWEDQSRPDVRLLAIFPAQVKVTRSILSPESLIVNISSVQQVGIARLEDIGIVSSRLMSFHPMFGSVSVEKSGWLGKQIIATRTPKDARADAVLATFKKRGVVIETMSPEDHDKKMSSHALAFFIAELIKVGAEDIDPRYLTGSARHMLGLLEFTEKSEELRELILSNPAFNSKWSGIKERIESLQKKFGWG